MEGAKEDMAGERILSIDEDDRMSSETGVQVGRPRATLALSLREALSAECLTATPCIQ
jgi:hypothetical protein